MQPQSRKMMELAVEQARRCINEPGRPSPYVGAAIEKDGDLLGVAHRSELGPGEHAEFTLLEKKLPQVSVAGATLYTTLEPCTTRNHPKLPCARRIIERKIARVVIGMVDPNPVITGRGQLALRSANIEVSLFDSDLTEEIEDLNREFIRHHTAERKVLLLDRESLEGEIGSPTARIEKCHSTLLVSGNDCKFVGEALAPKLRQALDRGVNIRIIHIAAHSPAAAMLPSIDPRFRSPEHFQKSIDGVIHELRLLKAEFGDQIQVRALSIFPPVNFFITDPGTPSSIVKVEINAAHPWKPIDSRPHLIIPASMPKWQEYFINLWETYWAIAAE